VINPVDMDGQPLAVGDVVTTDLADQGSIAEFHAKEGEITVSIILLDRPDRPARVSAFKYLPGRLRKVLRGIAL
jgi:hypothetical protein